MEIMKVLAVLGLGVVELRVAIPAGPALVIDPTAIGIEALIGVLGLGSIEVVLV